MHSRNAKNELENEWKTLSRRWATLAEGWRDEGHHRFERDYWRRFETEMPTWLKDIEEISQALQRVERELEESKA